MTPDLERHDGGRRVAVTGVGLLTALGAGRDAVWQALLNGRCGIGRLGGYEPASLRTQIGAEITDFDPQRYAARRTLRMSTRNDQLAIAGAALAMQDSGIDLAAVDPVRAGVFAGGNKEISQPERLLEGSLAGRGSDGRADVRQLGRRASSAFHPLFYVEGLQSASLFYLSQAYGLLGPNAYFCGTSDAGLTAIGRGYRAVRWGEADVVLAGGFDDASSWWTMSKMDGLGVLSTANDRPAEAFRPYDRDRSGSVLGEGAAFLVLEELGAARRRGAHVYAEITGFAGTLDIAQRITPELGGEALAVAIGRCLDEARVNPADVGWVAAHGCATALGDVSEAAALRTAFGDRPPPASSVKPATGHLVAAAGALNAAVGVLAVDGDTVPATLNLDRPDPACAGNWVRGDARRGPVRHVVALARGLEGQQVALSVAGAGHPVDSTHPQHPAAPHHAAPPASAGKGD